MIIIHHNDMDGRCSGAIAYKALMEGLVFKDSKDIYPLKLIEANYGNPINMEMIGENENIIIVDFSIQDEEQWEEIQNKAKQLIIIDHHKSAIDKYKKEGFETWGLLRDGVAACELAWEYFYNSYPPMIVRLLGDYDVFKFAYGEDTKTFQEGIAVYDTRVINLTTWNKWFDAGVGDLHEIFEKGKVARAYMENHYLKYANSMVFETEFEGHKTLACNVAFSGSKPFESLPKTTPLMVIFNFNGKMWTHSVFANDSSIDCATIAQKYGGGGHKGAAGFQTKELVISV